MAILKKTKTDPTSLDAMRTQRDDLQARLVATEAQAREADPVQSWELLSRLATEAQVIERALSVLAQRIDQAERQQRAEQAAAIETARAERRMAALANVLAIAEQIAQQAQNWQAGLLADLDTAQRELAATGGYPPAPVGPALAIRQAVAQALQSWRYTAPEWVGLPTPPSREALALAEAQRDIARAEASLAAVKQHRQAQRWDAQGPALRETAGQDAALALVAARRRLYSLQDDAWATLPEDEQRRRLEAGVSQELAALKSQQTELAAALAQQPTR